MYAFFSIKTKKIIKLIIVYSLIFTLSLTVIFGINKFVQRKIYPIKYKEYVISSANEYNLDCALIFSVIKVESGFDKFAESSAGAKGLMQIMPSTAEYIAKLKGINKFNIYNEQTNIDFGCYYLRYLIDKFGDLNTVLYAYNAGEGKVKEWLKNKNYSLNGQTLFSTPYKETREYARKINKSLEKYKKLYRNILDKL